MKKCKTRETYRTAPGLSGIILQSSVTFEGMKIVVLKYGDCDWRVRYINEEDLTILEKPE